MAVVPNNPWHAIRKIRCHVDHVLPAPLRQAPRRLCGCAAALRPDPAAGYAAPREGAGCPPAAGSSPRTE